MDSTVSLGDVYQRLSRHIMEEIRVLVASMPSQNPERNTSILSSFTSRTRRKLLQLLALTRWLSSQKVLKLFETLDHFHFQLQDWEVKSAATIHRMFFLHSSIYSMRSPKPLISDAQAIMSPQNLKLTVPPAVFTCGQVAFPTTTHNEAISRATITIRAKLAMEKSKEVLVGSLHASLANGVLQVVFLKLFTMQLTVYSCAVSSPWRVLSFRIDAEEEFLSEKRKASMRRRALHCDDFVIKCNENKCVSLQQLLRRAFHHSLLNRLADYADILGDATKAKQLQSVKVLQDFRKDDVMSYFSVGLWTSDFTQ